MALSQVNNQGRVIDDPSTTQIGEGPSRNATGGCATCGAPAKGKYCGTECYRTQQRSRSVAERFWPKVNKQGPPHPTQPRLGRCWVWTGSRTGHDGYGGIYVAAHQAPGATYPKPSYVHRVSWEMAFGPIPAGRHVLHSCDNRSCVKPDHLFLGDQAANMKDAASKGRLSGARPNRRKVSDEQIAEIFALRRRGLTLESIGERFGVSKCFVSMVVRGKRRTLMSPSKESAA